MLDPPELSLRHYLSEGDINTCNILTLLDSGGFVKSFRTKKITSDLLFQCSLFLMTAVNRWLQFQKSPE